MKTATAVISRRALRHNLQRVRQLAPESRLVAVVKANAYGHGLVEAAQTFHDADCYGVARLSEALTLRAAGITKPILLLEGFFSADDLPLLATHQLETAVHSPEQLAALEQADLPHPIRVWMKLDTGMHRLGVLPEQADAFWQRLTECHNVVQPVNIMSHFCRADEPESGVTERQLAYLDAFAQGKPGAQSIAASGGILLWPQAHRDQVRPGIILYGVSPLDNENAVHSGFQPAMTLTSHLIAVREHKAGESVGYGGTWTSERDTRLGVVAIGYGDGYPRCAPAGTPVWINGREVPLSGRVSMDMITVDLGPEAQDHVGDEVILWGPALPVESIATHTGVSAYELITRLTQRTQLEYLDD
ncbi:alanine racemase [Brenneria roseae subsp. americana]|uniref:Alanine racemase n=1 Tax=Brenneria roseae subsp. americana TaxID=1508507 RepID=A0A2U1U291_9GAMM|nr:alanine racemase [Brenneria roseae]PWC15768.1 alanine racemase [Brenneria roseae subsp. americana]